MKNKSRAEEAMEKNVFKPFINATRCIVIVSGYYEWDP
jgi:putative SOS response-associated peptidase YedK